MNSIESMLHRLATEVWYLTEPAFMSIVQRVAVAVKTDQEKSAQLMPPSAASDYVPPWDREDAYAKPKIEQGVAVIPIQGAIAKRLSNFEKWYFSMSDSAEIADWVQSAAFDPRVKAIVLDVNSPGGSVVGTPELGQAIAAARAAKPVVAYADVLMASAAYWAAAPSDAIYASPSAVVGSIGTYMVLYDWTGYLEQMGIRAELFKGGKFKAAGVIGVPLSDAQRENFQQSVDRLTTQFRDHVRTYRAVADSTMEGQTFYASEAVSLGLVDSLTGMDKAIADALLLASMRVPARR